MHGKQSCQAATPCVPADGVNLPALALPQHRLYLFPEPQGQGARRAMGAGAGVPALTLGLWPWLGWHVVLGAIGAAALALTLGLWGSDAWMASVMRMAS